MKTVLFLMLICVLGAPLLASPSYAKNRAKPVRDNSADLYASIVIDADSGTILSQSSPDKELHPASLTKLMTLYMLFEALHNGQVDLDDPIMISSHAASMGPSKLGLSPGASIEVRDAIAAVVTKSANDVASAIGERLGGSETNFARLMTTKAHQLGMAHTNFVNASGLHDERQVSSARDMATLGRTIIQKYPTYYRNFSLASFTYRGVTYNNHNNLMKTYPGMDGMKTGFVRQSGFNLVASAVHKNRRIIGVVFGGKTANSRNAQMAALLDQGFAHLGKGGPALTYAATDATAPREVVVAAAISPQPAPVRAAYQAPAPPRKPGILVAYDTLNKISSAPVSTVTETTTQTISADQTRTETTTTTAYSDSAEVMNIASLSEGDAAEPAAMEHDAVTPLNNPATTTAAAPPQHDAMKPTLAAFTPPTADPWSIQVGAFSSRAATDKIIHDSLSKLPPQFKQANPMIAPLKTADGWVFRGRITGYTKEQAVDACHYLKDCMAIAP